MKTKEAITGALMRWIFFGVIIALLPVLFNAGDGMISNDNRLHFEALFERGELMFVAAAVLGAAIAELFVHNVKRSLRNIRNFTGLSAALVLVVSAGWFADIQARLRDNAKVSHHSIVVDSLWVFGFALGTGAACVVLAQFEERKRTQSQEQNPA